MSASVASSSTAGIGTGSVTISVPSGTASGDFLVATFFADSDGAFANMTAPTGWTLEADSSAVSTAAGFGKVFYKTATGSEGTSYVFGNGSGATGVIEILRITGSGSTFNVAPTWFHGPVASTTSLVAPSITTTTTGQYLTAFLLLGSTSATTITAPSGLVGTSFRDSGNSATMLIAGSNPAAGSQGTKTATSNAAGATPGLGYLTMAMSVGDVAPKTADAAQSVSISQSATGTRTRVASASQALTIAQTATLTSGPPVRVANAAQTLAISQAADSFRMQFTATDLSQQVVMQQNAAALVTKTFYFTPPTWHMHYPTNNRLWRRAYLDVGHSIIKTAGFYSQVDNPSDDDIELSDAAYIGGRTYAITEDEADALTAAGYGRWVTTYIGEPIPDVDFSQYGTGVYGTGPYGD